MGISHHSCPTKGIAKKKKTSDISRLLGLGAKSREYFVAAHSVSRDVFGIDLFVDQEKDSIYLLKSNKAKVLEDKMARKIGIQSSTEPKKHFIFLLLNVRQRKS